MATSVMKMPSPAATNCSRLCDRPVHLWKSCRVSALTSTSISNSFGSMRLRCTPTRLSLRHKQRNLSVFSAQEKIMVPLQHHRNIGIIGHMDTGKSTTHAQILYSKICGQKQERAITINSCVIPSHVDEAENALMALDGAIWLFDSVAAAADYINIEPQSKAIWKQADKYGVPRLCFVYNMDHVRANFIRTRDMIETNLFAEPLVLQLPIGAEENFKGVIDLVKMKAIVWYSGEEMGANLTYQDIPSDLEELANKYRHRLIMAIMNMDYEAMKMIEDCIDFDEATIKELIRLGTMSCTFVPVLCGSSSNNKGVQLLLDVVVDYLPSPIDTPPIKGILTHHIKNQLAS